VKGEDGIDGPYVDMGIILEPDADSQSWEGQQAMASFYAVGKCSIAENNYAIDDFLFHWHMLPKCRP